MHSRHPLNSHFEGKYFFPVIYAMYNMLEEKYYIGRTSQHFTKRWFCHVYQNSGAGNKFYEAYENSRITHWSFMVLELVEYPEDLENVDEIHNYCCERENWWIDHFNSIENGYNTNMSKPKYIYNHDQNKTN